MAVTEQQLAAAAAWLEAHTQASQAIKDTAEQMASGAWAGFEAWYDAAAVAAVAARLASLSTLSQQLIVGSSRTYMSNVHAIITGGRPVTAAGAIEPIRNGAPLDLVYTRPAETFKKAVAVGKPEPEAAELAEQRAAAMIDMDLALANRAAQKQSMEVLRIDRYRRVIHPELSKSGETCGLCIVASDRIYYRDDLMPIHDWCNCETMPISGDVDPGLSLNEVDLGRFYGDADSTQGPELKRQRYAVAQHGEYGPVLVRAGDEFRGPSRVALEDDPERAARLLSKAMPVLVNMEAGAATSDAQLAYQRQLVGRLSSIVGAAA